MYACISGADRGVGLELTKRLIEEGYFVFAGRYMAEIDYGLDGLPKDRLRVLPLDISSCDSVNAFAGVVAGTGCGVDLLINNAAILGDTTATIFDELDFSEMLNVINTNALGALRMSNAFAELVVASEQKLIVNISSEAGSISMAKREAWFGYCMSKAAVNAQAPIIHKAIRKRGGQVMNIHPGWVKTYMRGQLDVDATITAEESSRGIMSQIKNHKSYAGEKPVFIDYKGNRMDW